jgi:NAD(P)-dependent dehydrogenase (short-subunit alcohol dehydrogenase family)
MSSPLTRVALVTGGGHGIGRATAELLAREGASVVVADVDAVAARASAESIGGLHFAVDVADEAAVGELVAFCVRELGGLDWACNIAGISPAPRAFVDHTPAEWQRTIDVNLSGVFYCMQHELRQMAAQGRGGAIVNMASGAAVVPAPGQPQYTAAKHGVLGLTRQAAQEFAAAGIRVNAVLPGQTDTAPMRAYLDALPDRGERMIRHLPMQRLATPAEVARAVVWLCSDAASYVNGVALGVDGGLLLR